MSERVPLEVGRLIATPGVTALINRDKATSDHLRACVRRHLLCDWGLMHEEDRERNERSLREYMQGHPLQQKLLLMSAYAIDESLPSEGFGENTLWIMTEEIVGSSPRITTMFLPSEY